MNAYSAEDFVANTRGSGTVSIIAIAGAVPGHAPLPEAGRRILARKSQVFLVYEDAAQALTTFDGIVSTMTAHAEPMTMIIDIPGQRSKTVQVRGVTQTLPLPLAA